MRESANQLPSLTLLRQLHIYMSLDYHPIKYFFPSYFILKKIVFLFVFLPISFLELTVLWALLLLTGWANILFIFIDLIFLAEVNWLSLLPNPYFNRTIEVPSSRIVIVEGIYALSEKLRPFLDLRVSITGGVHFDLVKRVLRDIQRAGQEPEEIIQQISETVFSHLLTFRYLLLRYLNPRNYLSLDYFCRIGIISFLIVLIICLSTGISHVQSFYWAWSTDSKYKNYQQIQPILWVPESYLYFKG